MIPVRDICALVFGALLLAAVIGTGYFLREQHYTARDMTDLSAHRHKSW